MSPASMLDHRLIHNIRDMPLSAFDGPSPTRVTPIDYALGQHTWGQRSNFWQRDTRASDSIAAESKHHSLPAMNNKGTIVNVSNSVAAASRVGGHNITTGRNDASHITSSSTTLSNRAMGGLASPTKLRGSGILGIETSNAMTSLGQSSLLSGSAPDFEAADGTSSSTYNNRQGSTIGRGRRQFKVEDTEEFVPSHLKTQEPEVTKTRVFNDLDFFTSNGTGHNSDRTFHNSNQNRNTDSTVNFSSLQDAFANERIPHSTSHANGANGANGPPQRVHSNSIWDDWRGSADLDRAEGSNKPRKPSSLRPDVAAYRPYDYNNGTSSHVPQQRNFDYAYDRDEESRNPVNHGIAHAINQHAISANVNAYNVNSQAATNDSHNYLETDRLQLPYPNTLPSDANNLRFRELSLAAPYRNSNRMASTVPASLSSHEPLPASYYGVPEPFSFNNSQYGHIPDPSTRLPQYQQQCGVDQATSMIPSYYPDETQLGRSLSNGVARSELLEEFRTYHKSKKYELKDIYGYIVEFSGDQTGSRFIQTKLEQANSDEKEQIFAELSTNARQLMSDVFGNYVIQKMFEYGNQAQKKTLASYMQGNVLKLSLQTYGCRCVQKAFEHILTDQQAVLIKELENHVIPVVESQHGNHVIQKAVECIPSQHIRFIVDAHKGQVVRLSKHIYGCRIIQRMLEYCEPQARNQILDELRYAVPSLIDDQYANYVVQCMITKCEQPDREHVISYVQKELLFYSKHKYASNVVEKAIENAQGKQWEDMLYTLIGRDPGNGMRSNISDLLRDQFGNYVMQTVLKKSEGQARQILIAEFRHHLEAAGKVGNRPRQITAMAETLALVSAAHSPSSTSTSPQTPRTPTSSNCADNHELSIAKKIDVILGPFSRRDSQRGIVSFGHFPN